jgi:signal transduction histidine kinase
MPDGLSVLARKEIIAEYVNRYSHFISQREHAETMDEYKDINLSRSFAPQNVMLPKPSEQEIERALRSMKKTTPQDQLNCGACGYQTCLEKAVAVCQGLAEAEMCLPYLIEELEETCKNLQVSHKALETAQHRLVQTERLASMGQLSAGIAHEINNPLGTILIFSHMMMKELEKDHPRHSDLQMIASEATRCRNIVRGLLDFARQSRVNKTPTDVAMLMNTVRTIIANKAAAAGIDIVTTAEGRIPVMMLDASQIQQMLINLTDNAMDATPRGGRITLTARAAGTDEVELEVRDTGCGISRENLSRLFTPFFTTKEMGKGTGLGLAICYGIVKMHSGDISVKSEVGKGTVVTVSLPIGNNGETAPEVAQTLETETDPTT